MFEKITGRLLKGKLRDLPDAAALMKQLDRRRIPKHVAIIMDGNGRWAKGRGLPRAFGHRAGVESLRDIVKVCTELKIGVLTVYAFSTENWKRPRDEVDALMDLLVEYINKEMDELCANGVRVNPIGRLEVLPPAPLAALEKAREKSRNNGGLVLNIALNYGGRTEIIDAVRAVATGVKKGKISPEEIDEKLFAGHLYTAGLPDPDILIRPAGDFRVSNFLLWQLAYTEFWLTPVMWPDFRRVHLLQALVDFQGRDRRFGGLNNP